MKFLNIVSSMPFCVCSSPTLDIWTKMKREIVGTFLWFFISSPFEELFAADKLWSKRCNIEQRPLSSMLNENFQLPNYPIIFKDDNVTSLKLEQQMNAYCSKFIRSNSNALFIQKYVESMISRNNLLQQYKNQIVRLTSSNSYSQGEVQMPLGQYILNHVDLEITGQSMSTPNMT